MNSQQYSSLGVTGASISLQIPNLLEAPVTLEQMNISAVFYVIVWLQSSSKGNEMLRPWFDGEPAASSEKGTQDISEKPHYHWICCLGSHSHSSVFLWFVFSCSLHILLECCYSCIVCTLWRKDRKEKNGRKPRKKSSILVVLSCFLHRNCSFWKVPHFLSISSFSLFFFCVLSLQLIFVPFCDLLSYFSFG